jgi:hypothetical protein
MSNTAQGYCQSVPATAPEYPLAQKILSLITIAGQTANPAHIHARQQLPELLRSLVDSLFDRGFITPAFILASCGTYRNVDPGSVGTVAAPSVY